MYRVLHSVSLLDIPSERRLARCILPHTKNSFRFTVVIQMRQLLLKKFNRDFRAELDSAVATLDLEKKIHKQAVRCFLEGGTGKARQVHRCPIAGKR